MNAITVFCASSNHIDEQFHNAAVAIGNALADHGITLVYGGGRVGLMGVIARTVRARGGRVVGIITRKLQTLEQANPDCDEMIVVDSMQQRKKLLLERGDGVIVLPGGLGTYEEFFEVLVGRQLGEHHKPIGVVNAHGYYDPLLEMIAHGVQHAFIRQAAHELFVIHADPHIVLQRVLANELIDIDEDRMLPSGTRSGGEPGHAERA